MLIGGISGAGKTTFARELCRRTGLPYFEMDGFYHGPGWVPIPTFEDDVAAVVAQDAWVFDSHGYKEVRDLMWSRADTVVWLDLPRSTVVRRVTWRSAQRVVRREELWNGNRESWGSVLSWDPKRSVVRWAWVGHGPLRARYGSRCHSGVGRSFARDDGRGVSSYT